jgi:3-oxoadipate enol-lactonase/4-carboxymuconolactone decarboxylase
VTTVELHAELDGPIGAPPLVLLNSVGTSGAMWDAQVGPLAEQFQVVRVDARGHGRSPVSPDAAVTIADLGTDVLAVLDRLGIGRAHVAGLSLGGMTAMWLAAHHPDRVGRVALLCTSAHPGNTQQWNDRARAVRAGGMAAVADAVIDGRWITPALRQRDPGLYLRLRDILVGTDPESYAQCCEMIGDLDLRPDLDRIAALTLVVGGADDPALPVEHQQLIAAAVPGATLTVVPAAHLANIEQAGTVTQLLLRHFGAAATSAAGYATRRAVLGDAHVDRAIANTTELTAPLQDFLTRYAWGEIWNRPGLTRRERSIATLATLVALGAEHELALHVRAAITNGLSSAEIAEVLLHTAVYAGVPRSNRAFAIAQQTLEGDDANGQDRR